MPNVNVQSLLNKRFYLWTESPVKKRFYISNKIKIGIYNSFWQKQMEKMIWIVSLR